jgi:cytochrome P450 family 130
VYAAPVSAADAAIAYEPLSPGFADRAYETYRALRDRRPVHRDPSTGAYALTRFADVRDAAADPATFSSEQTGIAQAVLPMLLSMDPPRHDRLRTLVNRAFAPRRVAALEPRIRAVAAELLDALDPERPCELLSAFAWQLPSRVIGELIGVPPERREAFLAWTEVLVDIDPAAPPSDVKPFGSIYAEFAKLLEERRSERRDDLMSALLDAEIDGDRLTQEELLGFCFVLLAAGNDTTANLIGNGAVLLARHPEARALLAREPRRLPDAIEEMLRFESPVQRLPRRIRRARTLHGVRIPEGAEIFLVWGAANRDEREFPEPDRFDVARQPRHLAFGQGVHFCLGAGLARLEARLAFGELLARFPRYGLAEPPRWKRSFWARAHERIDLVLRP